MKEKMEERIVELETRLAFQDHTIEELNDVIVSQQEQLDQVIKELALLKEQVLSILAESGDQKNDPPPPHY